MKMMVFHLLVVNSRIDLDGRDVMNPDIIKKKLIFLHDSSVITISILQIASCFQNLFSFSGMERDANGEATR